MNKKIILIGGFQEVIELCEELDYTIIGVIDNRIKKQILKYPILGTDNDANLIFSNYGNVPLVISPDSPTLREELFKYYSLVGFTFETIISSRAKISKSSSVGLGSIIQDGVNLSANSHIGKFVKLNTGCNIMHDCNIKDFVTIAPNAVVLGRVIINSNSYVGANATILPEKQIAQNVIIGAGSVVTKHIFQSAVTYAGVPAKKINK